VPASPADDEAGSLLDYIRDANAALAQSVEHVAAQADYYVHEQSTPATTWTIVHNLGRRPLVAVTDSAGTEVMGGVLHHSNNSVELTFSSPFGGEARLY
jgi:hypothetical protein